MKDDFAKYLTRFFTSYLSGERGLSHNTIRAYGNTFLSFIDFMEKTRCIKADRISLEHLTRNNVSDFLHWTEENKGCGTSTRNQKLAAFHTFCKYMLYTDIFHLDQWQSILSIKSKHCEKQSVSYLSIDGIRLLLSLIPVNTRNGLRDLALIALLYDSGARVQELIDLTPTDLHLVKPYYVSLFGKGRKRRLVPLQEQQVELLKKYMETEGLLKQSLNQRPMVGIKEKIKIKWDEGYRIIAFEYGGGEYLCVMCKLANAKTPMQKYQINSSDINNFIKEIWNDSYDVIYVGG